VRVLFLLLLWPQLTSARRYVELIIAVVALYLIFLVLRLRISRLITVEKIPDTFGFVRDIRIIAAEFGVLAILGIVLSAVDPGNLDATSQVSWLWFVEFGILIAMWWEYTIPGFMAWRESVLADRVANIRTRVPEISRALGNDIIFNRFESFAEKNFIGESAKFLRDCKKFESWVEGRSAELVKQKAKAIIALYVTQNAGLQVNLSSKTRLKIEHRMSSGDVGADLFKEAQIELLNMIRHSLWGKFVAGGGLEGYLDEEAASLERIASQRASSAEQQLRTVGGSKKGARVMGSHSASKKDVKAVSAVSTSSA
jgi:hypothetical protein